MPKDDLSGKNLDNVSLPGEDMERSDLSNASLRHSNLKGAKLRDADVSGADLTGADLTGADLSGVDLSRAAQTEGVTLAGAIGLPEDGPPAVQSAAQAGRDVKAAVLDRIDEERAIWDSLFDGIPRAWLDLPDAIGTWSIRDVIAHLSAWREPFLEDLVAAVQGTEPRPVDWPFTYEEIGIGAGEDEARIQAVNDWMHQRNLGRSLDQVLAEAELTWTLLRAALALAPDRLLIDPHAFTKLAGESLADRVLNGDLFGHFHEEHEPGIRAWLTRMHGRPAAG